MMLFIYVDAHRDDINLYLFTMTRMQAICNFNFVISNWCNYFYVYKVFSATYKIQHNRTKMKIHRQ